MPQRLEEHLCSVLLLALRRSLKISQRTDPWHPAPVPSRRSQPWKGWKALLYVRKGIPLQPKWLHTEISDSMMIWWWSDGDIMIWWREDDINILTLTIIGESMKIIEESMTIIRTSMKSIETSIQIVENSINTKRLTLTVDLYTYRHLFNSTDAHREGNTIYNWTRCWYHTFWGFQCSKSERDKIELECQKRTKKWKSCIWVLKQS